MYPNAGRDAFTMQARPSGKFCGQTGPFVRASGNKSLAHVYFFGKKPLRNAARRACKMRAWTTVPAATSEIPDDTAVEIDIALGQSAGPMNIAAAASASVDIERSA